MDKFLKSEKNFKTALKLLEVVNHTTDDYLFVLDIPNDTNWFFGNIDENYDIREKGKDTNTISQMMNVVHPADRQKLALDIDLIAKGEKSIHSMIYRWINKKGNVVWVSCNGKVLFDENSKPHIMIGRVSEETLRHLYNPMTGLWNKNKLREDLNSLIKENAGYLMMLDIRGLAAINLSRGREFGDSILKEIANHLDSLDKVSEAYHVDHSNFAVVINSKNAKDVQSVYDSISTSMSGKCSFSASAVPLDKSVFIDGGQVMDSINVTLKKSKKMSDNRLVFFSEEELEAKIKAFVLLEDLKESVKNGFAGFELYYQPQVKCESYELYGVEALLRYNSPKRGRVFPDEFIPILEQSRLIESVGLWVLEKALLQCKEWRNAIPNLNVSVNFSAVQFEDKAIGEKIIDILKKTNMPGSSLTVEVTESIKLHSDENFYSLVKYMRAYGVKFSIDDFGTGYSNLGYLSQIDANEIKIDRSLISQIEKDTFNYKLIGNFIEFAKINDIQVCCEGVETSQELTTLEALRPDFIQGYLFDKPCTIDEFSHKYINSSSEAYKERLNLIEKIYKYKESVNITD